MRLTLPFASALLSATLLSAALPAVAQTHYCIGGDLDHLSQAEVTTCKAKMTAVREAVKRRGAPSGWHFMVVCDESGWQDVAALTGRSAARLEAAAYSTDQGLQVTFLRGSRMGDADGSAPAAMLNAALEGVPGRYARPGIDATPAPIPNVERTREVPTLLIADAREAESMKQDEPASGQ